MPTRRQVLVAGCRLAAAGALTGCRGATWPPLSRGGAAVLTARPGPVYRPGPLAAAGTHPLGLADRRDPVLHVPAGIPAGQPVPLVLALHGAGGDTGAGLALLQPFADERGLAVLAPASRGATWDAVLGDFGPDAALIDLALQKVFGDVPVERARVGVAGFSDGASYALGLGRANGGLFGRVAAFSPGFLPPAPRHGRPEILISHGDADPVLPLEQTSRLIVPELRGDGYDVTFHRFSGGHVVPPEAAREAVAQLT